MNKNEKRAWLCKKHKELKEKANKIVELIRKEKSFISEGLKVDLGWTLYCDNHQKTINEIAQGAQRG